MLYAIYYMLCTMLYCTILDYTISYHNILYHTIFYYTIFPPPKRPANQIQEMTTVTSASFAEVWSSASPSRGR